MVSPKPMTKNLRRLLLTPLIAFTTPAWCLGPADVQWRLVDTSMYDLMQQGYSIVGVTSDAQPGGQASQLFFLQKGSSVYKCFEMHVSDIRSRTHAGILDCFQLTSPHTATQQR